jgi:aminoglycoside N3'-acetyltransferase
MRQRSIDTNQTPIKQLEADLQSLGIHAGDTLMVHASVRSVGPVEERGQGVLAALLGVLGLEGTLKITSAPILPSPCDRFEPWRLPPHQSLACDFFVPYLNPTITRQGVQNNGYLSPGG